MSPTYFYDLTNRLVRYKEAGTKDHVVEYTYDTLNNLTKLTETIDGVVTVTTYQYDADNRITSETTGNATVVYAYDAFGRLTSKTTKNGAAILLTESYTYTAPTAATTSAQIATYTTVAQNGYSVTYSYTYDDNGNILSISDGSDATSYVYDSANQLIRENNEAGGFTYTWEYDAAGNILNKKEYAYTTGAVGTPGDTVAYSYTDSGWGDLLTSYDGTAITYDGIGNPAKLHGWSFTWEHG
ncbi:MAG: hypothetical protein IKU07_06245, partial [Oscillospiraceae bacterium]|nr:hypothetical protein [Oscillospiraceae bacterium]